MTYDEHLEIAASLPNDQEQPACGHCHTIEDSDHLYFHEASGCHVCQKCLGKFLAMDIQDAPDHSGVFEGWVFTYNICAGFKVVNDGVVYYGRTIDEVVEMVLLKMNRI